MNLDSVPKYSVIENFPIPRVCDFDFMAIINVTIYEGIYKGIYNGI